MTEHCKAFIFIKDYADQEQDRFFLWFESQLREVSAQQITEEENELVCHDYWLIAPMLLKTTQNLPKTVTDLDELRISTSGHRADRESREKKDITKYLSEFLDDQTIKSYRDIFNKKACIESDILSKVGEALLKLFDKVKNGAIEADEWDRYSQLERPVTDYLFRSVSTGIAINTDNLRLHKQKIDFDYYMALKEFSAAYNLPLEVPKDEDIIEYLEPKGFDFTGVDVEYVLKFVPMSDNFAEDLLKLLKISRSRKVLNSIPLSQKRAAPIVDSFGSITSRIYFKDPSLQNLAKRHRNILAPDEGKILTYVDYDQYEAGIMAALSGDLVLTEMYATGDLYEKSAEQIFGDTTFRKYAKRLFLSYAYGMKRQSLYDAAVGYGAERQAAKTFFSQFRVFENWKLSIYSELLQTGRISTSLGNHVKRERSGPLTEREKRSAVSQKVQGTASLIFKNALLRLKDISEVNLKMPMHDAVLIQHSTSFNPEIVAEMFGEVLSSYFEDRIVGKATISQFTDPD